MRTLALTLLLAAALVAQTDPAALAQQGKQAMAEGRFADAAILEHQRRRAEDLAIAEYRLSGPARIKGLILAVGLMATIAATLLGALRIRRLA